MIKRLLRIAQVLNHIEGADDVISVCGKTPFFRRTNADGLATQSRVGCSGGVFRILETFHFESAGLRLDQKITRPTADFEEPWLVSPNKRHDRIQV
jgi:hypothetical protein